MDEDVIAQLEEWWELHHGSVTEDYEAELKRLKVGQTLQSVAIVALGAGVIISFKMTKNLVSGMTQLAQMVNELAQYSRPEVPIPQHRPNGAVPFDQGPLPDVAKPFDPGPQETPEWVKDKLAKETVDPKGPEL